jgi:hypothetical protein
VDPRDDEHSDDAHGEDEDADADADSSDAASASSLDSDDFVQRLNVHAFLELVYAAELGAGETGKADETDKADEAGGGTETADGSEVDEAGGGTEAADGAEVDEAGAGTEAADGAEVDYGWSPVPARAANSASERSRSSGESWIDIDYADQANFEPVPEAELQARVKQWLREQRAAFLPLVCVREDER